MPKAYLYIRYSSAEQREGNSYDRQTEKALKYCVSKGYELVDKFFDDGVSGYTGANRLTGKMGEFISLVNQGKIEKGSVLIVENYDRFSRERTLTSLDTLRNLVDQGIVIHFLDQNQDMTAEKMNSFDVLFPVLHLMLSNQESKRKSELVGAAWAAKKKNALGKVLTKRVPLWLEVKSGGKDKPQVIKKIPERAKIIQRIFKMTANQRGAVSVTTALNKEGVPTFGKSKFWHVSYVKKILRNAATYGVYQPYKRSGSKRIKDGEPIENYFPPIVTKEEFLAVQTHKQDRKDKGGRGTNTGKNLFSSLVLCGKCGGKMSFADKGSGCVYYVCHKARNGGDCAYLSIRYKDLEARILAKVPEMFGFKKQEADQNEDTELLALRNKLFEARATMKNLIDLAEQGGTEIPEIRDRIKARRREQEKLEADINRRVGLTERQRVETANRNELKKNILQILEGDFKGIMAGKEDSERLRLKHHLAKIIKNIEIHYAHLQTGEKVGWWPKIYLNSGEEINVLGSPEREIYKRDNDEIYQNEEEKNERERAINNAQR